MTKDLHDPEHRLPNLPLRPRAKIGASRLDYPPRSPAPPLTISWYNLSPTSYTSPRRLTRHTPLNRCTLRVVLRGWPIICPPPCFQARGHVSLALGIERPRGIAYHPTREVQRPPFTISGLVDFPPLTEPWRQRSAHHAAV